MRTLSSRTVDVSLAAIVVALLTLSGALAIEPWPLGLTTHRGPPAPNTSLDPSQSTARQAPARSSVGVAAQTATASSVDAMPSTNGVAATAHSSDGLTVAIDQPPVEIDERANVTLTGIALGGVPPYDAFWSMATGEITPGWSIPWTAPAQPTQVHALFEVRDHEGSVALVQAAISVVATPFLELSGLGAVGDVGVPFLFSVNVSGGVGPFDVRCSVVDGASNETTAAPSDGTFTAAVVPESPGPVWVVGTVTDADGRSFSAVTPVGRATPPPVLSAANVPFAEVGYLTPLAVAVAEGTPPFSWSVAVVPGVSAISPATGTLGSDGAIPLSATFDRAGLFAIPVALVDASGVSVATNLSVNVSAGLNLTIAPGASPSVAGAPLPLRATISGGLPPYQYRIVLSDNELSEGNASQVGPIDWTATPVVAGYLGVHASVRDSTGRVANVTFTIYVAPAGAASAGIAPSSAAGTLAALATAGGSIAALAGTFVIRRWWRRRSTATPRSPPDGPGRTVVRELLAESEDGLDRSTLELLAEERHLSGPELSAAIAAWQRSGRVRVDDDGDGRQVVRWVPPTAPDPDVAATPAGRADEEAR
ncbi:MAG: hypothetical protein L3J77_03530 [Thermoplasmata archaeon]|nr:hypothetical protein [Thermoplasmata archaeon]